jgi:Trk K+ transport system NAD-binding subunit
MNDEWFLVCGLGSLGQHCVAALKEFGVKVSAIDRSQPHTWEIFDLPHQIDRLILGDCRQNAILEQAGIAQCRSALVVTSSDRVNAETALAIRQLNPHTRLVVRSAKENLNRLLGEQLGNFVAFEPTQLPAPAFALAGLGTETRGLFHLDRQWFRVVQRQLPPTSHWCDRSDLHELNTRNRRVLAHVPPSRFGTPPELSLPSEFYQWNPEAPVRAGDTLVYIEAADPWLFARSHQFEKRRQTWKALSRRFRWHDWQQRVRDLRSTNARDRTRRVAIVCGVTVLVLLVVGTLLLHGYYPGTSLLSAFYATAILLLGGYADLFGEFQLTAPIPWWLQLFSLGLTVAGTAFVGVLYALLTETLLSARFKFSPQRPPVPAQDHVVVIGLGRVGRRVATLLLEYRQPLVGINFDPHFDPTILPQMPLIVGNLNEALAQVNLETAKSAIVCTDDEILNLEIALMARVKNPRCYLAIRTYEQRLSDHLAGLLPNAQVICAYAVAAEAFAGAAFGERILSLFRLGDRTILVTEYQIEPDDTLNGLMLAEVAYGYGVVPLLYQKPRSTAKFMPSEDTYLSIGDRMVVLATTDGLRRVEVGALAAKQWQLSVEQALTPDAVFEGANAIARISGCNLGTARSLMNRLPAKLPSPLYQHQGQRLVRELAKLRVLARLEAYSPTDSTRP